jgi:carbon-monoxide dehydrogenase iron sulfur subunit
MDTGIINLNVDVAKCTACHACELACSFTKEGFFAPALSRIQIVQVHEAGLNVPVVCVNCADAPCIPACPVGAVYRDRAVPVVRIKAEDCIGCGDCIRACPFGAVDRPAGKDVAIMCDLCGGEPACARSCIYGALTFERKDARGIAGVKRWATARIAAKRIRGKTGVEL